MRSENGQWVWVMRIMSAAMIVSESKNGAATTRHAGSAKVCLLTLQSAMHLVRLGRS